MSNELCKLTAVETVSLLKKREITPLDLIDAAARRIADIEPAVNALPTLCLDRARDHAKRIMAGGGACEAQDQNRSPGLHEYLERIQQFRRSQQLH